MGAAPKQPQLLCGWQGWGHLTHIQQAPAEVFQHVSAAVLGLPLDADARVLCQVRQGSSTGDRKQGAAAARERGTMGVGG